MADFFASVESMPNGSTAKIGEKTFSKNADGSLTMTVAVPIIKTYSLKNVIAHRDALIAEISELDKIIAEFERK